MSICLGTVYSIPKYLYITSKFVWILHKHNYLLNFEYLVFCVYLPNTFIKSCTGESSLTIDALAKHDERQIDKDGDVSFKAESDVVSAAGKTFNTWATNWTECTNTTFGRVHRYWASNSAFHKEVIKLNKMLSLHSVGCVL